MSVRSTALKTFRVAAAALIFAGGFILPNDRVDVILNQKVDVKNSDANGGRSASISTAVSRTVMTNLRVLAIDQTTEPAKGAVSIVGAVAAGYGLGIGVLARRPGPGQGLGAGEDQGRGRDPEGFQGCRAHAHCCTITSVGSPPR